MPPERPSRAGVAVVVPFYGSTHDAAELRATLLRLDTRPGDEIVVADNTEDGRFGDGDDRLRVVPAPLERSSYYSRNTGAESTSAPWLLFIDSDTRPPASMIDDYFREPIADEVGVLAGAVRAAAGQTGLIPRYAASRGHIDPSHYAGDEDRRPAGITANLLVRRAAWESVAGFQEGVRSGADLEFCWRVQDAGWRLEHRPDAALEHEHVETLKRLVRKTARHASGGGWVNDRYPGAFKRPQIAYGLGRAAVGTAVWLVTGRWERGLFKAIDGVFLTADALGRLVGNRALRDPLPPPEEVVVAAGRFPERGTARAEAALPLAERGPAVRVVADRRAWTPAREVRRALVLDYAEDEGWLGRGQALAALLARSPRAVAAARRAGGQAPPIHRLAPAARRARAWTTATVRPLDAESAAAARRLAILAGRPLAGDQPTAAA